MLGVAIDAGRGGEDHAQVAPRAGVEQGLGPVHVGVHVVLEVAPRVSYPRPRREVKHPSDLVGQLWQRSPQQVGLVEGELGMGPRTLQVKLLEPAGVVGGERVHAVDRMAGVKQRPAQMRADESSCSGTWNGPKVRSGGESEETTPKP